MFERFTPPAREVVVDAQFEARRLRHGFLGGEHLLLALTRRPADVAGLLREHGVSTDAVEGALNRIVGLPDAAALATIGIDLDEVRTHVEAVFGPGALFRATTRRRRRRRDRRRCADSSDSGALPFNSRAKRCLETAAKLADPRQVHPERLALALIAIPHTVASEILTGPATNTTELRIALTEQLRGAG